MLHPESISLKDLLLAVRQELYRTFDCGYWIRAEISEIRENVNGHCYLELIEKDTSGKLIVAKTKAAIWADTYRMLKPYFKEETGQSLNVGLKILVEVAVNFHEVYGFSCVIRDIDPSFTLGDLAKKRRETIEKLKEDGVWEMNKSLEFPEPLNRIAVISSASAAGYGDFQDQLQSNKKGYKFYVKLFPAVMQGEAAASSIIEALDAIYTCAGLFDAVAIIRGGGATTDMLAFDEYDLAAHCAQFPLPVITGIGHDRDESVVDMVAHTRCKTPTAVAAFLIDKMAETEADLFSLQNKILNNVLGYLAEERNYLSRITGTIRQKPVWVLQRERQTVEERGRKMGLLIRNLLDREQYKMKLYEKTLSLVSPANILKKGYSLTAKNGKIVRSVNELKTGDVITTILPDGKKQSVVN
jgi:exodeoxyribonuclease VII large subunit